MDSLDLKLWNNITFKTNAYSKNYDFVSPNENIITLYDGTVSEIRMTNNKPTIPIGEYGLSVWNFGLGRKLNVDFGKLIKLHDMEDIYLEMYNMVKESYIDTTRYNKIVFVHTFILHDSYKKRGVSEEFTEMLYRNFYTEDTAIIMLVKPLQNNPIDADYYFNRKRVHIKKALKSSELVNLSAVEYYSLNKLNDDDVEINEYKLFNVASKCGFNRINGSFLFSLSPDKPLKRLIKKKKENDKIRIRG